VLHPMYCKRRANDEVDRKSGGPRGFFRCAV
jgi:hypothetical protein